MYCERMPELHHLVDDILRGRSECWIMRLLTLLFFASASACFLFVIALGDRQTWRGNVFTWSEFQSE